MTDKKELEEEPYKKLMKKLSSKGKTGTSETSSSEDNMSKAYRVSSWYTKRKMEKEDPELARALELVEENDVIVVRGCYDKCERVLKQADIPHVVIEQGMLEVMSLRPDQMVFINCPGHLSNKAIRNLVRFVEEGGVLVTTDGH